MDIIEMMNENDVETEIKEYIAHNREELEATGDLDTFEVLIREPGASVLK